jgi:hypothetical protein
LRIDAFDIGGWIGTAALLYAYWKRQTLSPDWYAILNLAGAVLLAVLCCVRHAWPAVVLDGIWALIAARDLWSARKASPALGGRNTPA